MPVTVSNPTESYVLVNSHLNISTPSLSVLFSHRVNGIEVESVPFEIRGAAFLGIFGVPAPDTTTPLATVLSTAIYNAAINAGLFAGTVAGDAA